MSPTFVGTGPSIEMVIFCALGGRLAILGAVYGALVVNWAKTSFSESFPELWLFAMGALFIGVVMAFPNGLAGLYQTYIAPWLQKYVPEKFHWIVTNKYAEEKPVSATTSATTEGSETEDSSADTKKSEKGDLSHAGN